MYFQYLSAVKQKQVQDYLKSKGYVLEEKIGQGNKAEVFKGHQINQKQIVAIKILINMENKEHLNAFNREKQILNQIKNKKYVIQIIDDFQNIDLGLSAIVLDYYDCGFDEVFRDNTFTFEQLLAFSFQILQGMHVLQMNGIFNRGNIKSKNVLYSQQKNQFVLNLSEFEHYKIIYQQQQIQQDKHQIVDEEQSNLIKEDVFNVGQILTEILISRHLTQDEQQNLKSQSLLQAIPQLQKAQNINFFNEILDHMINPDIQQILQPVFLLEKLKAFQINENSLKCINLRKNNQSEIIKELNSIEFTHQQNITQSVDLRNYQEVYLNYQSSFSKFLFFNIFGISNVAKAISIVSQNTNIVSLDLNLSENNIRGLTLSSLGPALLKLTNISKLVIDLCSNYFKDEGLSGLCQCLEYGLGNLENLKSLSLYLDWNMITDTGLQLLGSTVLGLKNISNLEIEIENNSIGSLGASSLVRSLENLKNLQELKLNFHSNSIGPQGASDLSAYLGNLIQLSELNLDLLANSISKKGASSLGAALAKLINLKILTIDLFLNEIGTVGASAFFQGLKTLVNLQYLTLSLERNSIGQQSGKALGSALKNLNKISELQIYLGQNKIGEAGLYSLGSSLAKLDNLQDLTVGFEQNDIGAKCVSNFISSISQLNLQYLCIQLNENKINTKGQINFCSDISNLINLQNLEINLEINQINGEGIYSLGSAIKNLANLQNLTITLSENQFEESELRQLTMKMKKLIRLVNLMIFN